MRASFLHMESEMSVGEWSGFRWKKRIDKEAKF